MVVGKIFGKGCLFINPRNLKIQNQRESGERIRYGKDYFLNKVSFFLNGILSVFLNAFSHP